MTQPNASPNFEERLLVRLRGVVAERGAAQAGAPVAEPAASAWLRGPRLALGGGLALAAAVVAGALILSSGPSAQPAAAQILRETAAVAITVDGPSGSAIPGPGQFLYTKVKRVELTGWIDDCDPLDDRGCASIGATMSGPDAFNALVATTQENWLGEDGVGRMRWVAGTPRFWSQEERSRWEAAGSPAPPPFDPEYQRIVAEARRKQGPTPGYELRTREENSRVVDTETIVDLDQLQGRPYRFPDTSSLPTDAVALRRAIESNDVSHRGFNLANDPSAERLDSRQTTAELLNILSEGGPMTPQLRAAIFNALAEMPGIEVETGATDSLGREGYAIRSLDPRTGGGLEYVFDPETAELLARRSFLGPRDNSRYLRGVPAGTTILETAYLASAIVDSTDETAADAEAGEPVAHIGVHRG